MLQVQVCVAPLYLRRLTGEITRGTMNLTISRMVPQARVHLALLQMRRRAREAARNTSIPK